MSKKDQRPHMLAFVAPLSVSFMVLSVSCDQSPGFPNATDYDQRCTANSDCVVGFLSRPCVSTANFGQIAVLSRAGWDDYRNDYNGYSCLYKREGGDSLSGQITHRPTCENEICTYQTSGEPSDECTGFSVPSEYACSGQD